MTPILCLCLFAIYEGGLNYVGEVIVDALIRQWRTARADAQRVADFQAAFADALSQLQSDTRLTSNARKQIAHLLSITQLDSTELSPADRDRLAALAEQIQEQLFLTAVSSPETLAALCRWIAERQNLRLPQQVELELGLSIFVQALRDQLFQSDSFKQTLLDNQDYWQNRQPLLDGRTRYLKQLITYHQSLDFRGLPDLRDRRSLELQQMFIHLRGEEQRLSSLDRWREEELAAETELSERFYRESGPGPILDFKAVLQREQRVVVLGDPGSGKTTLLKYITLAFAQNHTRQMLGLNERRLPIFVTLYQFAEAWREQQSKDYTLVDFLQTQATKRMQVDRLPPNFFRDALERGACCLCFDGLDELGDPTLRGEIRDLLKLFMARFPRNRYILSSRIVGYDDAPLNRDQIPHYRVQPLRDEDIAAFVTTWYKLREPDGVQRQRQIEDLLQTLTDEPSIRTLAENPLLLTLILLVHKIEAVLPHERVQLYRKCIELLSRTWELQRRGRQLQGQLPIHRQEAVQKRLLRRLAFWLHQRQADDAHGRDVKEGVLQRQTESFLLADKKLQLTAEEAEVEARDFIELVKQRMGLLVEYGDRRYAFAHQTFQEFLAADYLNSRYRVAASLWEQIEPLIDEAHWREIILLLFGLLNDTEEEASDLMRLLLKRGEADPIEPVLPRYHFLAAQVMADRVALDTDLSDKIVTCLFTHAQYDTLARSDALHILGMQKGNDQVKIFLRNLTSNSEMHGLVRYEAAQSLVRLNDRSHAMELLLSLANNLKVIPWVRNKAASTLSKLGEPSCAAKLLLGLATSKEIDASSRCEANRLLCQLEEKNQAVIDGLLGQVNDAGLDALIRREAARALGILGEGNQAVIVSLLSLVRDTRADNLVRGEAATALGMLGEGNQAVIISLISLVSNPNVDAYVRRGTAMALGELGDQSRAAIRILHDLANQKGIHALVRDGVAKGLSKLGKQEKALDLFLELATDVRVHPLIRIQATRSLGALGEKSRVTLVSLLGLVNDTRVDALIRGEAARTLINLGEKNEMMIASLLSLASDTRVDAKTGQVIARALGESGEKSDVVLTSLLSLASDEEAAVLVRSEATWALGELGEGNQVVLSNLLNLASHEEMNAQVRLNAYSSLKRVIRVTI